MEQAFTALVEQAPWAAAIIVTIWLLGKHQSRRDDLFAKTLQTVGEGFHQHAKSMDTLYAEVIKANTSVLQEIIGAMGEVKGLLIRLNGKVKL